MEPVAPNVTNSCLTNVWAAHLRSPRNAEFTDGSGHCRRAQVMTEFVAFDVGRGKTKRALAAIYTAFAQIPKIL